MTGRASEELGVLASITAAIEVTQTEVTDIKIETTDRICRGEVRLSIPLEDVNRLDDARIVTDRAGVIEEALQIDLDIEIDVSEKNTPDNPTSVVQQQDDSMARSDTDRSRDSELESRTERVNNATDDSGEIDEAENETPYPDESGSDTTESSGGRDMTVKREHGDSEGREEPEPGEAKPGRTQPVYRNPEELSAVYDEEATFKEMKTELGADVTAQTIRKYMIKYGIHEPKQRPDRLLESIRPSEFELMNSDEEEQSDRTRRPSESDSDGSGS